MRKQPEWQIVAVLQPVTDDSIQLSSLLSATCICRQPVIRSKHIRMKSTQNIACVFLEQIITSYRCTWILGPSLANLEHFTHHSLHSHPEISPEAARRPFTSFTNRYLDVSHSKYSNLFDMM